MESLIDIFCLDCGYDLRGLESERCPECGAAVDREGAVSRIPWTRRAEIGRVRTYVRTFWMVLRQPGRVAEDVARPVSLSDAKRFRWVTVFIALIGPAVGIALLYSDRAGNAGAWPVLPSSVSFGTPTLPPMPMREAPHRTLGWVIEGGVVVAAWVGCWLFLLSASTVASCFFHPPGMAIERQNRAVAVSYYACAPWALMPLTVLSLTTWATISSNGWFPWRKETMAMSISTFAASLAPIGQIVGTYVAPLAMLRRATLCGAGRLALAAIALPIAWALLAVIFLIGLPVAYLFVALVVMSVVG